MYSKFKNMKENIDFISNFVSLIIELSIDIRLSKAILEDPIKIFY